MIHSSRAWVCQFVAAVLCPALASAQPCAPSWSDEFTAGEIDGLVRCAVAADLDGEGGEPELLYIGGGFTRAGGLLSERVVAFDGRRWHTLGAGLPDMNIIYAAAAFDDGSGMKVYVGGEVKQQFGVPKGRVYCWDGAAWAQVGGDFPANIRALASFDDGTGPALYAGGFFYGSEEISPGLSRWDGVAWQPVGGGLSGGNYQYPGVYSLTAWDDGGGPALFVGGNFEMVGAVPVHNIARWDGGAWAPLGDGLTGGQYAPITLTMAAWDDGSGEKLYVAGRFQSAGVGPANNTARWNGQKWEAAGLGLGEPDEFVNALASFSDNDGPALFACGPFASVPDNPKLGGPLARWNGSAWSAVPGFWGTTSGVGPRSLAVFDGAASASLYIGGDFEASFMPADYLMRLTAGTKWEQVGNGLNRADDDATVSALRVWNSGSGAHLHVGGRFLYAGGSSGAPDPGWQPGAAIWSDPVWKAHSEDPASFHSMASLSVFDGPEGPALFAGANLISGVKDFGSVILAQWTGGAWREVPGAPAYGDNRRVETLMASRDASIGPALFVGGQFTQAGNQNCNSIARFDGESWSPLGTGLTGGPAPSANALAVFDDGPGPALFAAGEFTTAGDQPAANIARWDGLAWSALGEGLDGPVRALCIFDDGAGPALYAGGAFSTAGGQPAANLARWDGQSWSPVGAGIDGEVLALAVFDDGAGPALYIGGDFTLAGGQPASNLARFDGAAWSGQGLEADGPVRALLPAWEDGHSALWVGGSFLSIAGTSSGRIARLDGCACYADFDGSGDLDMADFLLFLALFEALEARADCDASATWDLFDFLCFQNAFNTGC